jgi:hypothetical protein
MIARTNPRHAWHTLLWGACCFALVAAAAQVVLPARLDIFRDPPYTFRRERLKDRLAAQRQSLRPGEDEPALVVTLGSSRVANGVDGAAIEAYLKQRLAKDVCIANFGTRGCGPLHNLVLLGRLLRDGFQPDLVVVEAMPVFFAKSRGAQLPPDNCLPITPADRDWLQALGFDAQVTQPDRRGVALYEYRTDVLRCSPGQSFLARHQVETWISNADAWGTDRFQGFDDAARKSFLGRTKASYHNTLHDLQVGEEGLAALRVLLNECHRRKISTAVVLMPEGPTFRGWYRPGAREELQAALDELARECGSTLVVSSEWIEESDFLDSHHLLFCGATKFSERLCQEALEPLLTERLQAARPASLRR